MFDYPYVTVPEFRAHPTFLDTNNLRTGLGQDKQDAALNNILLEASQWADDKVNMPLAAHVHTERTRLAPDRTGRLRYHPEHAPVIAVLGMATGLTPDLMDQQTDPQVWTESDGRIIVAFAPSGGPGLSSLQFGYPAANVEQLVSWTYVAGFPATQLAEPVDEAATELQVRDATGITVGSVLRLWTPGQEEAVTVGAVSGTTATLARPLAWAHGAGASCSGLPTTVRQAVINYACTLLMRPASTTESFTAARGGAPAPTSTSGDSRRAGRSSFLYDEACKLLKPYKRIR